MARFVLPSFSLVIFFIISSCCAGPLNGTELVKQVCTHTSDYNFCVQTLSSDANAGASEALAKELVNAALRLAQTKSSSSQDLITHHLNNASTSAAEKQLLQRCLVHNGKAISALSLANNDLNSDSFLDMVEEMQGAAAATENCQYIIKGTRFTALEDMNRVLINLCEIGIVSTKYFSADDFY
ncbi:hypothetical protein SLA2020_509860 [Shorea laevis]